MRAVYVNTVYVQKNEVVSKALKGYLRGQWVHVNGMKARIVNHVGNKVVLWMQNDGIMAVWP